MRTKILFFFSVKQNKIFFFETDYSPTENYLLVYKLFWCIQLPDHLSPAANNFSLIHVRNFFDNRFHSHTKLFPITILLLLKIKSQINITTYKVCKIFFLNIVPISFVSLRPSKSKSNLKSQKSCQTKIFLFRRNRSKILILNQITQQRKKECLCKTYSGGFP